MSHAKFITSFFLIPKRVPKFQLQDKLIHNVIDFHVTLTYIERKHKGVIFLISLLATVMYTALSLPI